MGRWIVRVSWAWLILVGLTLLGAALVGVYCFPAVGIFAVSVVATIVSVLVLALNSVSKSIEEERKGG